MVRSTVDGHSENLQITALKELLSKLPPGLKEVATRITIAVDAINPDIIRVILPAIHEQLMKVLNGTGGNFSQKISEILSSESSLVPREGARIASNDDTYLKEA